jgi:hypothetical protein
MGADYVKLFRYLDADSGALTLLAGADGAVLGSGSGVGVSGRPLHPIPVALSPLPARAEGDGDGVTGVEPV